MICENCNHTHTGEYGSGRFCSCKCARGFSTKANRTEINLKKSKSLLDRSKKLGLNPKIQCKSCNKEIKPNKYGYCVRCSGNSLKWRESLSKVMIGKNVGKYNGDRSKSSRGIHGKYLTFYFDSSWELAWIIYNIENKIDFIRNRTGFPYVFEGITRNYYPDFKIQDEYFEIKNYITPEFKAKLHYFPYKITVLSTNEIKPYLVYCTNKYGKYFYKPYQNNTAIVK